MLQPYSGFLNNFLQMLRFEIEPLWSADSVLAWVTIVVVTLWRRVDFNMILFLAALQEIPESLYEAGAIDGASDWQKSVNITIPQIMPAGRVVLLLQVLASYKVFVRILLITGGGPGGSTRPFNIYEAGFYTNQLGLRSSHVVRIIFYFADFVIHSTEKSKVKK